ncbi:hypothetical protein VT84_13965 [Gemmata sp. SH-PL17]|uniref:hypothetical protein n=1 Tax=Gemmata sp. SH-PL17 TaxID=1630693 RepID=UPI00078C5EBE|nr:hypothetical protein [Gemmata sp. SH-PL17]AMV25500.1 hypothetical protein VT84_13965 [Gemmata sp. SH-PL17]
MMQILVWTPPTSGTAKISYTVRFDACSLAFDEKGKPTGYLVRQESIGPDHPLISRHHSAVVLPFEQCEYRLQPSESEQASIEEVRRALKADIANGLFPHVAKPCSDCGYRPGDRGAVATGGESDAPDSYDPGDGQDHEAADEPDEYTHFAGTVVSGGGAYEVWGKHEVDQDQLAACFRDIAGKQFMFASPDFELVKVGD